eukprot:m.127502 g.127502  ORF g.127502 m.127502 type:complete len:222 (+) comp15658_c4_seq9:250-915(+)
MMSSDMRSAGRQPRRTRPQRPEMICPLPPFDVKNTPSRAVGVSGELELRLRIVGCELIQSTGILLKCSQVVMACAQILYQRFFCRQSFLSHRPEHIAVGCLFLAAKVEEEQRRLRVIMNVSRHVMYTMSRNYEPGRLVAPLELGSDTYHEFKNSIIRAERRILKELGFCIHLDHPHKLIISIQSVLALEHNEVLQTKEVDMKSSRRPSLPFPKTWLYTVLF